MVKLGVAAIAPWFRLCLPSYGPGIKSQAHHLHFFQLVLLKLYRENNEMIGPLLKKCQILFQYNLAGHSVRIS